MRALLIILIGMMGCAHADFNKERAEIYRDYTTMLNEHCSRDLQKTHKVFLKNLTVFVTPPGVIEQQWDKSREIVLTPNIVIVPGRITEDGLIMPNEFLLGHGIIHLLNKTRPDLIVNPDKVR